MAKLEDQLKKLREEYVPIDFQAYSINDKNCEMVNQYNDGFVSDAELA